jgi:hypothetical protein
MEPAIFSTTRRARSKTAGMKPAARKADVNSRNSTAESCAHRAVWRSPRSRAERAESTHIKCFSACKLEVQVIEQITSTMNEREFRAKELSAAEAADAAGSGVAGPFRIMLFLMASRVRSATACRREIVGHV